MNCPVCGSVMERTTDSIGMMSPCVACSMYESESQFGSVKEVIGITTVFDWLHDDDDAEKRLIRRLERYQAIDEARRLWADAAAMCFVRAIQAAPDDANVALPFLDWIDDHDRDCPLTVEALRTRFAAQLPPAEVGDVTFPDGVAT